MSGNSRAAWARVPPGGHCEAPRHSGPVVFPAEWRFALMHPDGTSETYSLCTACVDAIAADLGTTAEQGAISRG